MSKREVYYASAYYGQPELGPPRLSESHRQFKSVEKVSSERHPQERMQIYTSKKMPLGSNTHLAVTGVSSNPTNTLNSDLVTSVSHLPKSLGGKINQEQ